VRYVVAVAGPAGGGKTSLVRGLVARLEDAAAIHMDDYERMTQAPIGEVMQWMERGADVEELAIPLLADHLRQLKGGQAVRVPARHAPIVPRKYIVFETQFGRAHRPTGEQIDLLIWIDTPLEIALARKLKDITAETLRDGRAQAARERLAWLDGFLANYLALVRRLMLMQREKVRPHADIVVDGTLALEGLVQQTRGLVLQRLP